MRVCSISGSCSCEKFRILQSNAKPDVNISRIISLIRFQITPENMDLMSRKYECSQSSLKTRQEFKITNGILSVCGCMIERLEASLRVY